MAEIVSSVYDDFKEYYLENSDNYDTIFKNYVIDILHNFSESDFSPLKTLAKRENEYIKKNNTTVLFLGGTIVLILILIVIILHNSISNHEQFNLSSRKQTVFIAIFTVLLLISFQIIFYFFGIKYKYIGMNGVEELYHFILNKLVDSNKTDYKK